MQHDHDVYGTMRNRIQKTDIPTHTLATQKQTTGTNCKDLQLKTSCQGQPFV